MEGLKAPAPKVFYFGYNGSGHYLVDKDGDKFSSTTEFSPWGSRPDGTLCPEGLVLRKLEEGSGMQPEGKALLHHKDGWTALGFWDRSGDTRLNSNSNFLVRGTYTFDEMLALAKEQFHDVFARIKFPITEINALESSK
jgi:hypothetical protein